MATTIFRKHWMAPAFGLAMTVALLCPAAALAQLQVCANIPFSLISAQPAEGVEPITYTWYENDQAMGSHTASICITEGRSAGMYAYVRKASNAACEEMASNTYTVEVLEAPVPTNPSTNSRECSGTVTFSASVPAGITIDWYDAPIGGNLVAGSVTSFTHSINSSTTYYAQARHVNLGCVSAERQAVGGTVIQKPNYPTNDGTCAGCNIAYIQLRDGCSDAVVQTNAGTYSETARCSGSCVTAVACEICYSPQNVEFGCRSNQQNQESCSRHGYTYYEWYYEYDGGPTNCLCCNACRERH